MATHQAAGAGRAIDSPWHYVSNTPQINREAIDRRFLPVTQARYRLTLVNPGAQPAAFLSTIPSIAPFRSAPHAIRGS